MKLFIGHTLTAVLLVFSLLYTHSATAAPPSGKGPISFSNFDLNSDGVVTEAEFYQVRGERMAAMANRGMPMRGAANAPSFASFDKNQDGQLTEDEFNNRVPQMMQRNRSPEKMPMAANRPTFGELDSNGDDLINAEEFNLFHQQRFQNGKGRGQQGFNFEQLDQDGSGAIDHQEFTQHQSQNTPRR